MYLPAYHTALFAQKVLHKVWTEFVAPQSLCPADSSNKLIRKKMPSLDAFPFRLIWVKINLIYRAHISLTRFRPVSHSQARLIVISHPFICSLWRSISRPLCWHESLRTHTHTHTHTVPALESCRVTCLLLLWSFLLSVFSVALCSGNLNVTHFWLVVYTEAIQAVV